MYRYRDIKRDFWDGGTWCCLSWSFHRDILVRDGSSSDGGKTSDGRVIVISLLTTTHTTTGSDSHERKNKEINKKYHRAISYSHYLSADKTIATPPPTTPSQPTLVRVSQYILTHYSSKTPFVSSYTQPPSRAKRS